MIDDHMPTPNELGSAPELAVLAVLDAAIEAATRALVAACPELCDDTGPPPKHEAVISGCRLLSRAHKLQTALVRYRQTVLREPPLDSGAADDLDALSAGDAGAF